MCVFVSVCKMDDRKLLVESSEPFVISPGKLSQQLQSDHHCYMCFSSFLAVFILHYFVLPPVVIDDIFVLVLLLNATFISFFSLLFLS